MTGRPAARNAALNRTGAGSDRSKTGGQADQGTTPDVSTLRDLMQDARRLHRNEAAFIAADPEPVATS
jgi:hypothetical protein